MLIDRYAPEDVFARVPELARQTDPVLKQLDVLLEDDQLFEQVKADLSRRRPHTTETGRPSTPVEVILRLLVVQHLDVEGHVRMALAVERDLVGQEGETGLLAGFRDGERMPRPVRLRNAADGNAAVIAVIGRAAEIEIAF